ncbi:MAG: hypothetical protein V4819_03345 [Verrucomicrobiota bacterium]
MIKRFRWVFLAMLAGGAVLWIVLAGSRPKIESAKAQSIENNERQSSRHRTREVEKNLATPLEKKVAEQERLVEDKKAVLSALGKTGPPTVLPPILLNPGGAPPSEETPEEAAKKVQAAQDVHNARLEYFAARKLLEKLKLELVEEQKNAEPGVESR